MQCPEKTRTMIMMSLDMITIVQKGLGESGESIILPKVGMLWEMSRIKKRMLMRNMDISFLARK